MRKILNFILENKLLIGIVFIYILAMLSIIDWGIPNLNHPYNYHMDEWHQFQSLRTTFKDLSANVPGSAHGTMFHFILSGIFLIPFYLFRIIDPFAIKSSVESLQLQQRLFEILRLNTLIFGILSLFFLSNFVKKYFKVNSALAIIFFTVTPLWLSLSNYFKYDIALIFWIIISLFFLLKYGSNPTLKNFIVAGFISSLAVATKISAIPLFLIYFFSFFYFSLGRKAYKQLLIGLLVFIFTFVSFGIPDLILRRGDYGEFLSSNLTINSTALSNYILESNPWWREVIQKVIPFDFGYVFSAIFLSSIAYWSIKLVPQILKVKFKKFKNEIFVFISMVLFIISLVPLQLGANGNRLLVLLPFFAIFSSLFMLKIFRRFPKLKIQILGVLIILFAIQFFQSFAIVYVKWQPDPRELSSRWIIQNIKKGSTIGIENIPIYQLLPDLILKEFYSKKSNNMFKYEIVNNEVVSLPGTVVITNKEYDLNYLKKSPKKDLLIRLVKEGYVITAEFKPNQILYRIMGNEFEFQSSGIVPISTITIYKRDKNPQN